MMATTDDPLITQALRRISAGDQEAAQKAFPLIFEELHRLARRRMRNQPKDHTLQTTALVNEAYLKLFQRDGREWKDRKHFFRMAAAAMRTILVDSARKRSRKPRSAPEVMIDSLVAHFERRSNGLAALDAALEKLEEIDPTMVRVVELRFFAGSSVAETAATLDIAVRHAEREWAAARGWLRNRLEADDD